MRSKKVTEKLIHQFEKQLMLEEKCETTVGKYMRDIHHFADFAGDRYITKQLTIDYKHELIEKGYAPSSVNSMLASMNRLMEFIGLHACCVKSLKIQHNAYCPETKELSRTDYLKLLEAAKGKERLYLALQTICGTGIRVSELEHFTVEAVKEGTICIECKNKIRVIQVTGKLQKMLLDYAKKRGISEGVIFRTRNGRRLDRSNIWSEMKNLCAAAGVDPHKVYPHNLRKLFARMFYKNEKDLAKLADLLGHTNINTTRIYIISTGTEHRKKMEKLGLVV